MTKLPKYVFIDDSTLVRTYRDNVQRSDMAVGPSKTRPIQSVPLFDLSADISIPTNRFNEFNAWFKSIGSGAYWFLMNDPFDGTSRRFRFSQSFSWRKAGTIMRAQVTLEAYDV